MNAMSAISAREIDVFARSATFQKQAMRSAFNELFGASMRSDELAHTG
jgi:hypothetical protein